MADRVDAGIEPMQSPDRGAMADGAASQAEVAQLRERHHTPLPLGQRRQPQRLGWAI